MQASCVDALACACPLQSDGKGLPREARPAPLRQEQRLYCYLLGFTFSWVQSFESVQVHHLSWWLPAIHPLSRLAVLGLVGVSI